MSKTPKTYLNPKPDTGYAQDPELDARVRANRDDAAPFLVYADWLTQKGDPRGELIMVQHKRAGGATDPALEAREKELLSENQSFLGGVIPHGEPRGRRLADGVATATWRWGFFDSLRLFNTIDWMDGAFPTEEVTTRVFQLPAAACLRELKVGVLRWEYQARDVATVIEQGKKAPFAKELSILRIGDVGGIDIDCAHHEIGDVSDVSKAFPNLRELTIWGYEIGLKDLDLPKLETLKIQTCGLSVDTLGAVVTGKLPALARLELWFGSEDYGCGCTIDDVRPLLDSSAFPKLKHLGLMNTEMADDICSAIGEAKLLPQLESLNLSMGTMGDAGARSLLEHRERLKHLKSIDVSDNFLTEEMIEELKGAGLPIVSRDQKDLEDDYRYVTVAE